MYSLKVRRLDAACGFQVFNVDIPLFNHVFSV